MAEWKSKLVSPPTQPTKQAQGPIPATLERISPSDPDYNRHLRAILDAMHQQIKDLHGKVFEVTNPSIQPADSGGTTPPPQPVRQEVFVQPGFPVGLNYPADVFIQTAPGVYAHYVFNPSTATFDLIPAGGSAGVESRYEIFADEEIEVTAGRNMLLLGSLLNNGAILNNGVMAFVEAAQ